MHLGAYTFSTAVGEIRSSSSPKDFDALQHPDIRFTRSRAQLDGSGDTLRMHSNGNHSWQDVHSMSGLGGRTVKIEGRGLRPNSACSPENCVTSQ